METSGIEWIYQEQSNEHSGQCGGWSFYVVFDKTMNEYSYTMRHGRASYVTGNNRSLDWVKNQCEFYAQNF